MHQSISWTSDVKPMTLRLYTCHHCLIRFCQFSSIVNSLAPGKFEWKFRYVIFKWNLVIDVEASLAKLPSYECHLDFTDDQSTLVQVITSHYPSQCWPRSLSPYGVTRPQWVNYITYTFDLREHAAPGTTDLKLLCNIIQDQSYQLGLI